MHAVQEAQGTRSSLQRRITLRISEPAPLSESPFISLPGVYQGVKSEAELEILCLLPWHLIKEVQTKCTIAFHPQDKQRLNIVGLCVCVGKGVVSQTTGRG